MKFVNGRETFGKFADEYANLEVERTVAKADEKDAGGWLVENGGHAANGLGDCLLRFFHIGAASDADANERPRDGIAQGPIDDAFGDKALIGYEHFFVIPVGNRRRANLKPADCAADIADRNRVAHADGALTENDQTADEVGDNLL